VIGVLWDNVTFAGDLAGGGLRLEDDGSLRSAVLISLFSDARAKADDRLPDDSGDRRGWPGDAMADVAGDRIGSRLWLLRREKQTEETRRRAAEYAREALLWLIDDGLAASIEIEASWLGRGILGLRAAITLSSGAVERYELRVGG
jgi:phage gp46-like protein